MTRIAPASSLLALLAALALTGPAAAEDGHDDGAETAEAHDDDHAHDEDHAGDDHADDDHAEDDHGHDDHAGDDHAEDDHGHDDEAAHAFEAAGVTVVHPWMNATDGREALIFLALENTGDATVSLQGADVPFAESATLVGFALQNGEGTYQPLPFVPVQPGRSLDLAPEGLAILATGLTQGFEEGANADITLLTSAGEIALTVAVEAQGARQHSHSGHNH